LIFQVDTENPPNNSSAITIVTTQSNVAVIHQLPARSRLEKTPASKIAAGLYHRRTCA
jgi:hypothetical protein